MRQKLAGQSVRGLVTDGRDGVLAIVGRHSLCRRSVDGEWSEVLKSEHELACCVALKDNVFVGTADAQILRVESDGTQHRLIGFADVAGRDGWYAGTALVDGKLLGPPLGVRSMTATCDGAALLANVHVGGIPRSSDSGITWQPTIDIESDVHEVCAHPTLPEIVIAACAVGLCVSRDAGATWTIERNGLHESYCSAVACGRADFFVAASTDPFATQAAIYKRSIDGNGPLEPIGGGLPARIAGIADTNCIATRDATVAVIDASGRLYVSLDDGATWSVTSDRVPNPSALYVF